MPALPLDAALVHLNRADAHGNAQYLGPDLYFDDLFCMAAERRLRLVRAGRRRPHELARGRPRRDAAHRPHGWSHGVVEAPERRPLHLLRARLRPRRGLPARVRRRGRRPRALGGVHARYLERRRGRYQAAVAARAAWRAAA